MDTTDEGTLEIENLDTPEETPDQETPESTETETVETPEPDKAELEANAALESEKSDPETDQPVYAADFKFKAAGKEHEVPENFRGLITDEKSEKEIKSLFEKAYGSDRLIEKSKKLESANAAVAQENTNIRGAIDGLKGLFMEASKPGEWNILKFDQWLEKVKIPQEFILNYALAKVKLGELPPEQRNAILAQRHSEQRSDALTMEQRQLQGQNQDQIRRLRTLEFNEAMTNPDMQGYEKEFDKRFGKTGAFRDQVRKTGLLAWHTQKVDLSPSEAIKRVIEDYNLTLPSSTVPSAPSEAKAGGTREGSPRPVVQRTTRTIPNVQGKGSQSPLKTKPRSIEDLKKLGERAQRGEAV